MASNEDQPTHAELGASSSERWISCPGSIAMSRGIPRTESVYAAEGTVAHHLAEQCLENPMLYAPDDFIGTAPMPDEYPDVLCDRDMAWAVDTYLDVIGSIRNGSKFEGDEVESRVDLAEVWRGLKVRKDERPAGPMYGTCDYSALAGDLLIALDYKHGQGVAVEVEGNSQLLYYAAGKLFSLAPDVRERISKVQVGVVQPRAEHPDGRLRTEEITVRELKRWAKHLLLPAAKATEEPDAPLRAGAHCRFCPASGTCPEQRQAQLSKARMVFSEDGGGGLEPEVDPEDLSVEEIRAVLDAMGDIQHWLRRVQERAHSMIEHHELTPNQKDRLGYKLVAKRAQRKWAGDEDETADRLCEEFGLGDEELFERKLRSPAQVEKEIGKAAVKSSETWGELVTSQSSGTTLVPADDPRPSVDPKNAADAFGGD